MQIRNSARERLTAGGLALGVGLRQARTVDVAPAMKTAGFDWLFIDLEHNAMTLDMAVQISVAANACGIAPIVRVPHRQYDMATRVLDGGAMGIVMPHVDTAEEAREAVARLKYPPLGHRSVGGPLAQLAFAAAPVAEATAAFNAAMLLVCLIESPQAVENADAMAAVPGIDVLMFGTSDLTMEMGIPGELGHARVKAAYRSVIDACHRHGKWAGMGGVYSDDLMAEYLRMGIKVVLAGSDLGFMMSAGAARTKMLRAVS
jgi:2-keto-3-deoxy-L-rhamnonate aldolase RhmA